MRIKSHVDIPDSATIHDAARVAELIRTVGAVSENYKAMRIDFEISLRDVEPSPLSKVMQLAVAVECERRRTTIAESEEGIVAEVIAGAIGIVEQWKEIEDYLRSKGWPAPAEPEMVID